MAARSAGYFYQLGKFAGRHRAGIVAAGMIVATLIAGIVATSWQARIAWAQSTRAEKHFNEVRKLANVFMFDFHTAIADLPGSTPARELLVKNSLEYLETLSAETGNEPTLQRELASAYEKMADVQGGFRAANLGDSTGAIASYRKALAIRQKLGAANPADRELKRDILRNYGKLGESLMGQGEMKPALEATRALLKIAQELASTQDATVTDRRFLATALNTLGFQLTRANQVGDGLLFLRQSVALYESLLESNPKDEETRRLLGLTYGRMGETLLLHTDDAAAGLRVFSSCLDIGKRLLEAEPRSTRLRKQVGYCQLGVGSALTRMGKQRAALAQQMEAVKVLRDTLDADEKNEVARFDAAFAIGQAGATHLELGDLASAEGQFKDAARILEGSGAVTSAVLGDSRVLLGVSYYRLGQTYAERARRASSARQRALDCQEARHWFELGVPILAEADRDPQWNLLTYGLPSPISAPTECTNIATAAK